MRHLRHRLDRAATRPGAGRGDDVPAGAPRSGRQRVLPRPARGRLGHTRLAIIDPAGGAQPLCNEDGTVWVTFNGEIFNYVELGEELRGRGHTLPHGERHRGHRARLGGVGRGVLRPLQRAVGARRSGTGARRRLVLCSRPARRPAALLHRTPAELLFASEVKALFADPPVGARLRPGRSRPDPHLLVDRRAAHGLPGRRAAPAGPRRGLRRRRVPHGAATGASTSPSAATSRSRTWPTTPRRSGNGSIEATRLRFVRSDVPVGAYLSGGIDSAGDRRGRSARYTDAPLHTFSLRFADAEFDEGDYQQQMVGRLGTAPSRGRRRRGRDIAEVFPEVVWHAETPILRAGPRAAVPAVPARARDGYKVVVTGEGADEVLGGYDIFREARVRAVLGPQPRVGDAGAGRRAAVPLDGAVTRARRRPSPAASSAATSTRPTRRCRTGPAGTPPRPCRPCSRPPARDRRPAPTRPDAWSPRCRRAAADWDPLSRAQWLEMTTLLPGYILASQGDRMLMANSVEGRFPFLDRDVVEFANALPARHKLFGLEEKYLLKRAFADLVPRRDPATGPSSPTGPRTPPASSPTGPARTGSTR